MQFEDPAELEKLIHNCEFENQQSLRLIEQEETLIETLKQERKNRQQEVLRCREAISKLDEDTKFYHRQFTINRDNCLSIKRTNQVLFEQERVMQGKLEMFSQKGHGEKEERSRILQHYQDIWRNYEEKYKRFPLAQKLDRAREEEMKFRAELMSLKDKVASNNKRLESLRVRKELEGCTTNEFIIRLAELKVSTRRLVRAVQTLEKAKRQKTAEDFRQSESSVMPNKELLEITAQPESSVNTMEVNSDVSPMISNREDEAEKEALMQLEDTEQKSKNWGPGPDAHMAEAETSAERVAKNPSQSAKTVQLSPQSLLPRALYNQNQQQGSMSGASQTNNSMEVEGSDGPSQTRTSSCGSGRVPPTLKQAKCPPPNVISSVQTSAGVSEGYPGVRAAGVPVYSRTATIAAPQPAPAAAFRNPKTTLLQEREATVSVHFPMRSQVKDTTDQHTVTATVASPVLDRASLSSRIPKLSTPHPVQVPTVSFPSKEARSASVPPVTVGSGLLRPTPQFPAVLSTNIPRSLRPPTPNMPVAYRHPSPQPSVAVSPQIPRPRMPQLAKRVPVVQSMVRPVTVCVGIPVQSRSSMTPAVSAPASRLSAPRVVPSNVKNQANLSSQYGASGDHSETVRGQQTIFSSKTGPVSNSVKPGVSYPLSCPSPQKRATPNDLRDMDCEVNNKTAVKTGPMKGTSPPTVTSYHQDVAPSPPVAVSAPALAQQTSRIPVSSSTMAGRSPEQQGDGNTKNKSQTPVSGMDADPVTPGRPNVSLSAATVGDSPSSTMDIGSELESSPFNLEKHREKLKMINMSPGYPLFSTERRMFDAQDQPGSSKTVTDMENITENMLPFSFEQRKSPPISTHGNSGKGDKPGVIADTSPDISRMGAGGDNLGPQLNNGGANKTSESPSSFFLGQMPFSSPAAPAPIGKGSDHSHPADNPDTNGNQFLMSLFNREKDDTSSDAGDNFGFSFNFGGEASPDKPLFGGDTSADGGDNCGFSFNFGNVGSPEKPLFGEESSMDDTDGNKFSFNFGNFGSSTADGKFAEPMDDTPFSFGLTDNVSSSGAGKTGTAEDNSKKAGSDFAFSFNF